MSSGSGVIGAAYTIISAVSPVVVAPGRGVCILVDVNGCLNRAKAFKLQ